MASTDEVLGRDPKLQRIATGGRPKVSTHEVAKYLNMVRDDGSRIYTKVQIARVFKCSAKTISRREEEAEELGLLISKRMRDNSADLLNEIEAEFDDECKRAMGTSFKTWIKGERKVSWAGVFNFCRKNWMSPDMWNKPDLARASNQKDRYADQLAQKFVDVWLREDPDGFRDRLKKIRPLFKFLERGGINDKYLRMKGSRAPRRIRTLGEIETAKAPGLVEEAIKRLISAVVELTGDPSLGSMVRTFIHLKTVGQMRTGGPHYHGIKYDDRGIYGIRKGSQDRDTKKMFTCPLRMGGPLDDFSLTVKEKNAETWRITHLTPIVQAELWELYNATEAGELIFGPLYKLAKRKIKREDGKDSDPFLHAWREITAEVFEREFIFHDCRKISLTWYYVYGIPLVRAVKINVGWNSIDTAYKNYAQIDHLMKRTARAEYKANLPAWFAEGLDEFIWGDMEELFEKLNTRIEELTNRINGVVPE